MAYCGRAKAGCGTAVGVGDSVGSGVSVGGGMVAEGTTVSVGRTGSEVGDAQETIRKKQTNKSKTLVVEGDGMELILLDLRYSLNDEGRKIAHTRSTN